jgi:hypothetical protein
MCSGVIDIAFTVIVFLLLVLNLYDRWSASGTRRVIAQAGLRGLPPLEARARIVADANRRSEFLRRERSVLLAETIVTCLLLIVGVVLVVVSLRGPDRSLPV